MTLAPHDRPDWPPRRPHPNSYANATQPGRSQRREYPAPTSIHGRAAALAAAIAVAALCAPPASAHAQQRQPQRWTDAYPDFDDLTDELRELADASDAVKGGTATTTVRVP
ncbi:MAG: hypothetical protein ACOC8B_06565 [Gemmatimonadota bacterium]